MTIKVLELVEGCMPHIFKKGDWIDLKASKDIKLKAPQANRLHKYKNADGKIRDVDFDNTLIPLGIITELPKGFEALIAPRSHVYIKYGIIQPNSPGVVDETYCGENDEWRMSVEAHRNVTIPKGTRIAHFRIQLSQKATMWQKIKWLFSNKVVLKQVDHLTNKTRGGFGSTGQNDSDIPND